MSTNQILATIHNDYLPFLEVATDEELAQFVRAQIRQSSGEEVPELTGMSKALFEAHTALIERLEESRKKKSEAGKQGGNPQLKQSKPCAEQNEAEVKQAQAEVKQVEAETKQCLSNDKAETKQCLSNDKAETKQCLSNDKAETKQCLSNDKAELKPNTVSYSVSNSVSDNNSVVVSASASEEDFARVSWRYGESIGPFPLPSKVSAGIMNYLDHMEPDVVIDAIIEAAAENKRSWSYVEGILRKRKQAGIRNMADVARDKAEHENARVSPGASKRGKNKGVSNDPKKHGPPTAENLANMEKILEELKAMEVEEPPEPKRQPEPLVPVLADSIGMSPQELERIMSNPLPDEPDKLDEPEKPKEEPKRPLTDDEYNALRDEQLAKLDKLAVQP